MLAVRPGGSLSFFPRGEALDINRWREPSLLPTLNRPGPCSELGDARLQGRAVGSVLCAWPSMAACRKGIDKSLCCFWDLPDSCRLNPRAK